MVSYTVVRDTEYPDKWRVFRNGVAIGSPGTYDECESYLDLLERGEE